MLELKRRKASAKLWFYFVMIFFLSGISGYLVNTFLMTGQLPILNVIVVGLILAIANILFVELQIVAAKNEVKPPLKKKPFRKAVLGFCIAIGIILIGCVVVFLHVFYAPFQDIEDMNGSENTALAVITTEEILSSTNHYSAFSSSESYKGAQTDVSGKLKGCDYDQIVFQCQKISGVKTIQLTKTTSDRLTLEISPQLTAGNLEIVITVDNKFYKNVDVNGASSVELSDIANKVVAVKIGAESAAINISITRHMGT